ncbi:MAG TPA: bifunctional methylenetetrahydrofolate dehydrogenase/methenyltetrahydrofolate cyclohydrolase FolD [Candidatus Acidoferrales bacterium]|nr:bifunctional methylenetetrahydrofolate dehydrogenase/methenyltetrahydrofolate cyclohydrolase FolD [Candidatus Acidoferrales bacterium]
MAQLIDGKATAAAVRAAVQRDVVEWRETHGNAPGLATVLVGDDAASATYVRGKRKACAEVGITSFPNELPAQTTQQELLALVRKLNQQGDVHGILVQLPLPKHIDSDVIIEAIDPAKDVDGLHPISQARLVQGREGMRPCTPLGVMRLLDDTGFDLKGARAVVAGRSNLVGKPVAFMLLERHATVTICHSRTRDLAAEVANADVLIAAIGRSQMIRGEWIRPGSVVIDVGINRQPDGRLVGDVEFAGAKERAAFITPVPGGVGPMTIAMLMQNTLTAAKQQASRPSRVESRQG